MGARVERDGARRVEHAGQIAMPEAAGQLAERGIEPLSLHDHPGVEDVHRALKGREPASGTLVGTCQR